MIIITRLGLTALALALLTALFTGCGGGGGGNAALTARIVFPPEVALTDAATITVRGTAASASTITSVVVGGVNATSTDGFRTWVAANVPLIAGVNVLQVEISDDSGNTHKDADRSLITRGAATDDTGGGVFQFDNLFDIALDAVNRRLLVTDNFSRALVSVDIKTGERIVISNDTTGTGTAFVVPRSIVLRGANALVGDDNRSASTIVEVDLANGNRTEFAPGSAGGPNFLSPGSLVIDAVLGELLVLDNLTDRLLAIDLAATGNTHRIVSDNSVNFVTDEDFDDPWDIVLEATGNSALVVNNANAGSLVRVDLTSGDRTTIASPTVGGGNPQTFLRPTAVALEDATTALVQVRGLDALVRVDLTTGEREIVADDNTGVGPNMLNTFAMAYDPMTRIAYLGDVTLNAVLAVDTDSGDRVILSR